MDTNIRQIDKEIIAGILSALKRGKKTVSYSELSKDIKAHTGRYVNPHVEFNKPLGNIQTYCSACGVPCLSAVVVNQDQISGSGFLSCYREVYPEDHRSEEEALKSEQERCASQSDWSPLLEYCDIAPESIWDASSPTFDFDVLNWSMLVKILDSYENDLVLFRKKGLHEWKIARCFQNHWNIEAPDFGKVFADFLEEADDLLRTSRRYLPILAIKRLAENNPERVRLSFRKLFDESTPLTQRLKDMDEQLSALDRAQTSNEKHVVKNTSKTFTQ